jgi:hypothetical protein
MGDLSLRGCLFQERLSHPISPIGVIHSELRSGKHNLPLQFTQRIWLPGRRERQRVTLPQGARVFREMLDPPNKPSAESAPSLFNVGVHAIVRLCYISSSMGICSFRIEVWVSPPSAIVSYVWRVFSNRLQVCRIRHRILDRDGGPVDTL